MVIWVVRSSEFASATVTMSSTPSNCSARPYLAVVPLVRVTPFWRVPVLLWPEESEALLPVVSLKPYAATGPLPGGGVGVGDGVGLGVGLGEGDGLGVGEGDGLGLGL